MSNQEGKIKILDISVILKNNFYPRNNPAKR